MLFIRIKSNCSLSRIKSKTRIKRSRLESVCSLNGALLQSPHSNMFGLKTIVTDSIFISSLNFYISAYWRTAILSGRQKNEECKNFQKFCSHFLHLRSFREYRLQCYAKKIIIGVQYSILLRLGISLRSLRECSRIGPNYPTKMG